MATSWPTVAATDYAADKAVRTSRVQALLDRDAALARYPLQVQLVDTETFTSTGFSADDDTRFQVYIPSLAAGKKLALNCLLWVRSSGATAEIRIGDSRTGTGSVAEASTTAVSPNGEYVTTTIDIPDSWVSTVKTFWLQRKVSTGTADVFGGSESAFWFED